MASVLLLVLCVIGQCSWLTAASAIETLKVGAIDPYSRVQAEDATFTMGTSTASSLACPAIKSGYVDQVDNGDYIAFYNVDFGATGASLVEIHFADGNGFGHFASTEIHLESPTGQLVASIETGVTGDWCKFMVLDTFLRYIPTGIHNVYFVFATPFTNNQIFNLDWIVFNTTAAL